MTACVADVADGVLVVSLDAAFTLSVGSWFVVAMLLTPVAIEGLGGRIPGTIRSGATVALVKAVRLVPLCFSHIGRRLAMWSSRCLRSASLFCEIVVEILLIISLVRLHEVRDGEFSARCFKWDVVVAHRGPGLDDGDDRSVERL